MNGIVAITVICLIWGFGEIVAIKTKSIISSIFVASAILLIGFQVGLPRSIFKDSALLQLGALMIAFVITHLGTMISIKELKKQWKTVLITLVAVAGVTILVLLIGIPTIGKTFSVAAIAPITGSAVASVIIGEAATALGMDEIAVFAALIITLQGFVGYPISAILLKKEANRVVAKVRRGEYKSTKGTDNVIADKKKLIPPLPKNFQTTAVLMLKMGLIILFATWLESLMLGYVSRYVLCLLLGIFAQEIGFLEKDIFNISNAMGLVMITVMVVVFAPLANADLQMLVSLIKPFAITFGAGVLGIIIFSAVMGKVLGYSTGLSIVLGLTALYGFPGTYILSTDAANTTGETAEEKQAILDEIMPKMLVAGFMTVTVSSVVLAGVLVKFLV